jgi:DNA-directed RNA polymerase subunit M
MEFCPKCGALLMMKKVKFGCPRCSYTAKEEIKIKTSEKMAKKEAIAVVDEKVGEVYPITDYDCEKCKNRKAYFWIRQMRSGDEPESKFYKCTNTKCKNVVRVDD